MLPGGGEGHADEHGHDEHISKQHEQYHHLHHETNEGRDARDDIDLNDVEKCSGSLQERFAGLWLDCVRPLTIVNFVAGCFQILLSLGVCCDDTLLYGFLMTTGAISLGSSVLGACGLYLALHSKTEQSGEKFLTFSATMSFFLLVAYFGLTSSILGKYAVITVWIEKAEKATHIFHWQSILAPQDFMYMLAGMSFLQVGEPFHATVRCMLTPLALQFLDIHASVVAIQMVGSSRENAHVTETYREIELRTLKASAESWHGVQLVLHRPGDTESYHVPRRVWGALLELKTSLVSRQLPFGPVNAAQFIALLKELNILVSQDQARHIFVIAASARRTHNSHRTVRLHNIPIKAKTTVGQNQLKLAYELAEFHLNEHLIERVDIKLYANQTIDSVLKTTLHGDVGTNESRETSRVIKNILRHWFNEDQAAGKSGRPIPRAAETIKQLEDSYFPFGDLVMEHRYGGFDSQEQKTTLYFDMDEQKRPLSDYKLSADGDVIHLFRNGDGRFQSLVVRFLQRTFRFWTVHPQNRSQWRVHSWMSDVPIFTILLILVHCALYYYYAMLYANTRFGADFGMEASTVEPNDFGVTMLFTWKQRHSMGALCWPYQHNPYSGITQFASYYWLHGSLQQLLVNMFTLLVFGWYLESSFQTRILFIYAFGGWASGILFYFVLSVGGANARSEIIGPEGAVWALSPLVILENAKNWNEVVGERPSRRFGKYTSLLRWGIVYRVVLALLLPVGAYWKSYSVDYTNSAIILCGILAGLPPMIAFQSNTKWNRKLEVYFGAFCVLSVAIFLAMWAIGVFLSDCIGDGVSVCGLAKGAQMSKHAEWLSV